MLHQASGERDLQPPLVLLLNIAASPFRQLIVMWNSPQAVSASLPDSSLITYVLRTNTYPCSRQLTGARSYFEIGRGFQVAGPGFLSSELLALLRLNHYLHHHDRFRQPCVTKPPTSYSHVFLGFLGHVVYVSARGTDMHVSAPFPITSHEPPMPLLSKSKSPR